MRISRLSILNVIDTGARLYFDLDDTAASFTTHFIELTGRTWRDPAWERLEDKWAVICGQPNFFLDLRPLDGFLALWEWAQPYEPCILSAAGHYRLNKFTDAERRRFDQKREWCARWLNLTGERVIIVPDWAEKATHCTPGDLLIDDSLRNVRAWEAAGGIGILHRFMPETRARLERLTAIPY